MALDFQRYVDRWIPAALARNPDELRRARLVVVFSALLSAAELAFLPSLVVENELALSLSTLVTAVLFFLPVPLLRVTGSLRLPGTLLCSVVYAGGVYFGAMYGGIEGSPLVASVVLPVLALLLMGQRAAIGWLLLLSITVVMFGAEALLVHSLRSVASREESIVGNVFLIVLVGAFLIGAASLFESAKERMRVALEQRNVELQTVLDNVGQGFFSADPAGRVVGERSSVTNAWFGPLPEGASLWDWLGAEDESFSTWARLGWSAIADDMLPLALLLEQLPHRLTSKARIYRVEYRPVLANGVLHRIVVVVTDITDAVATEAAEAEQRMALVALQHAHADRTGFLSFLDEADKLVEKALAGEGHVRRHLHTLKGMCAMFGAEGLSVAVHALESSFETGEGPLHSELSAFGARWRSFLEKVAPVIGPRERRIELDDARYQEVVAAVERRVTEPDLLQLVRSLAWEPTRAPLSRMAEYARVVAQRVGKPEPQVQIESGDLLFDPVKLDSVWSSMVHILRNAVDHGIEGEDARVAAGKPAAGQLALRTRLEEGVFLVEVQDDGSGIDWDRVGAMAAERGLPASNHRELTDALFSDGLSTRTDVTELSGRGIGAGAFREAVRALGGEVEIQSSRTRGTLVRARLPSHAVRAIGPARRPARSPAHTM